MSDLGFNILMRLNAYFDPTLERARENEAHRRREERALRRMGIEPRPAQAEPACPAPKPPVERVASEAEIAAAQARRERQLMCTNPSQSRPDENVHMYRIALDGGVPRLMDHFMRSGWGSIDTLMQSGQHLLEYAMNVGSECALDAHRDLASFDRGLGECTRMIARISRRVLESQHKDRTLATEAFNFLGLPRNYKQANVSARAEVVLATLHNQLTRQVKVGRDSRTEPQLPLFRPPLSQPDEASRTAHYQVHNQVSIRLNYPDTYASEIVTAAQKLDPEGLAFWRRVPPPPALRSGVV